MEKKRIIIVSIFIVSFVIAIILSIIYYNDKYSVSFETGTEENFLTKYVNQNEKVEEPTIPTKEGYIFKEWQLNGETYNFDTTIEKDMILTAEWIKEEYINITFKTNSDYEIESRKILKGDIIDKLPEVKKDNFEFIGWYLNGEIYNNEEIYDDVVLEARYKEIKEVVLFQIGDKVKIIGEYAESSNSTEARNKKAIGWEREIVGIIENSEFPYVVGNKEGVTGFFKDNSIEKK